MPRHPTHYPGVFVVDFALDDLVAERLIVAGWRDLVSPFWLRVETGVRESKRRKDLAVAELDERFAGDTLEDVSEDDEADIAVLSAGPGIGFKLCRVGGFQQVFASATSFEEADVGW